MKAVQNIRVTQFKAVIAGLPFKIRRMDDPPEDQNEWNQHAQYYDFFEVRWIVRGTGTHWIDKEAHELKENSIFCIKPGQLYKTNYDKGIKGFVISFTESFFDVGDLSSGLSQANLWDVFSNDTEILIKDEIVPDLHEIVHAMMKEFENSYLFKSEILSRYLKIFLLLLVRQQESFTRAQPRNNHLVQHFLKLLATGFREKKMVADYAAELFVTPNYLNELVKNNTGLSAGYHIRCRIVQEAKRMALYSNSSMKEIAYNLGFADPAHFSKYFKAMNGANFTEFKKEKIHHRMAG